MMDNYTLLYQNTTTKACFYTHLGEGGNKKLFYEFDLTLPDGVEDGEYQYLLIRNDDRTPVVFNPNDLEKYELLEACYLVNGDLFLTDQELFLVIGGERQLVKPLHSGLMRVGKIVSPNSTYEKQQTYVVYGSN